METTAPKVESNMNAKKPLVTVYILGFFTAMILHELALEATTKAFSSLNQSTTLTSAVTLFQFGFCFLLPLILSKGEALKTMPKTPIAFIPYVKVSIAVFGATGLATMSLMYVSYPTKVVFKSAKLIPTMMVSKILKADVSYGVFDYMAALLLCAGAGGYSYGSGNNSKDTSDSWNGILLLTMSILCDALVPNMQKRLMMSKPNDERLPVAKQQQQEHEKAGLSPTALMVNINMVGFSLLLLFMIVSGSLSQIISASLENPMLILYLSCVGMGLSTAVLMYTQLIKASGPVVAVAVATLRKVATVVLSYLVFPKPLLPVHVASGVLVLAGIVLSSISRQWSSASRRS